MRYRSMAKSAHTRTRSSAVALGRTNTERIKPHCFVVRTSDWKRILQHAKYQISENKNANFSLRNLIPCMLQCWALVWLTLSHPLLLVPWTYNLHRSMVSTTRLQSSGAVWKSRWPSGDFRPNEHYGFCGRKATALNRTASALVTVCP